MLIQVNSSAPTLEVFGRLHLAGCKDLIAQLLGVLVADSFAGKHAMRRPTDHEVRRRTDILTRWLRKLCDGGKQPVGRALHLLRDALDAELDGRKYEPPADTMIRQDDGVAPIANAIMERIKQYDLAV